MPTIGVEFQTKTLQIVEQDTGKAVSISAQIWDTSGSERYRSIVVGHYREAVGVLLVFDLTDRESFECLDHWLTELRENCKESCQIALVANKVDLVNEDPGCREVSVAEIEKFAEYNNLMFVGETSAKEDINIKETFESLLQAVHEE